MTTSVYIMESYIFLSHTYTQLDSIGYYQFVSPYLPLTN